MIFSMYAIDVLGCMSPSNWEDDLSPAPSSIWYLVPMLVCLI